MLPLIYCVAFLGIFQDNPNEGVCDAYRMIDDKTALFRGKVIYTASHPQYVFTFAYTTLPTAYLMIPQPKQRLLYSMDYYAKEIKETYKYPPILFYEEADLFSPASVLYYAMNPY